MTPPICIRRAAPGTFTDWVSLSWRCASVQIRPNLYVQIFERAGLSLYERLALLDYLELALDGRLAGCSCYEEHDQFCEQEDGLAGCCCAGRRQDDLCEHVLEALEDPLLPRILEVKDGGAIASEASERVLSELPFDPELSGPFAASLTPALPSKEEPGTPQKMAVLRERVRRGLAVSRRGDCVHRPYPFELLYERIYDGRGFDEESGQQERQGSGQDRQRPPGGDPHRRRHAVAGAPR